MNGADRSGSPTLRDRRLLVRARSGDELVRTGTAVPHVRRGGPAFTLIHGPAPERRAAAHDSEMVIDVAIVFQAVPPGVAPVGFSILIARPPAPNFTATAEDPPGGGAFLRIRPE